VTDVTPRLAEGLSDMYLAQDLRHDRKAALKMLRPELATVIGAERFLAEIKTTANLEHPHGVIHRDIKPENILQHDDRAGGSISGRCNSAINRPMRRRSGPWSSSSDPAASPELGWPRNEVSP
jgi:hypothetical protein